MIIIELIKKILAKYVRLPYISLKEIRENNQYPKKFFLALPPILFNICFKNR